MVAARATGAVYELSGWRTEARAVRLVVVGAIMPGTAGAIVAGASVIRVHAVVPAVAWAAGAGGAESD